MRNASFVIVLTLVSGAGGSRAEAWGWQDRERLSPLPQSSAPSPAQAQPVPLTLEEAITQGLANSRRLAEIEARAEAADFAIAGRQAPIEVAIFRRKVELERIFAPLPL